MFAQREIKEWTDCLLRHLVLVGIAAFLMALIGENEVSGGWFAFPTSRNEKDDVPTKPNPNFETAIRAMMQKARLQASQGKLDEAIELADQAARISENSSTRVKLAQDVSPEASAQFARELRQRKAKRFSKRMNGLPPSTQANATNPTTPKSNSKARQVGPSAKMNVARVKVADVSASQNPTLADASSGEPMTHSGLRDQNDSVDALHDDWPQEEVNSAAGETKLSDLNIASANSTDADESLSEGVRAAVVISSQHQIAGSASPIVLDESMDRASNECTPQITPQIPLATKASRSRQKAIESSTRIKLRPRNSTVEGSESDQTANSRRDGQLLADEPRVVPRVKPLPAQEFNAPRVLREDVVANPAQPIIECDSKNQVESLEADEAKILDKIDRIDETDSALVVSFMETKTDDAPKAETMSQPASDAFEGSFSPQNVLELKQRLDSVMALNPGEVFPNVSHESLRETFSDSKDAGAMVVKIRKRRISHNDLPVVDTTNISTIAIRAPVVGKTSLIKWRSAKREETIVNQVDSVGSKSKTSANDLRESVSESTELQSAIPSVSGEQAPLSVPSAVSTETTDGETTENSQHKTDGPSSPQLHGSLWDHATAPPINEYPHSRADTSSTAVSEMTSTDHAPPPPVEATWKQAATDSPVELYDRHHRSQTNCQFRSSEKRDEQIDLSSSQLTVSSFENTVDSDDSGASVVASVLTEMDDASLTNEPTERGAQITAGPVSNASSMLGLVGMMVVVAGLWSIRTIVRARNS